MALVLIKLAEEYEITNKLGFFILDNAGSNNTYLRTFLHHTLPNLTNQDIAERRL